MARVGAAFPYNSVRVSFFSQYAYLIFLFSLCVEMDLFQVVNLEQPLLVTIGVRPTGENEVPIMRATDGHVVELDIPTPVGSPQGLNVPPVQSFPPGGQPNPVVPSSLPPPPVYRVDDSDEESEEESPLQKRSREDDGAESSKRPRTEAGSASARYVYV